MKPNYLNPLFIQFFSGCSKERHYQSTYNICEGPIIPSKFDITLCTFLQIERTGRRISWNSKLGQWVGDVDRMKSLVPINQTETNSLAKFTMQETEKSTQVRSSCRVLGEKLYLSIYSIYNDTSSTEITRTKRKYAKYSHETSLSCDKNIISNVMFLLHWFQRVKRFLI